MRGLSPVIARSVAILAALVALAAPSHATQRAVLIGVGDYEGTGSDLDGPRHDVEAMRDALIGSLGFRPEHIVALVDGAATRDGILDALDALVRDAETGDFAFIYLSGHGTSAYDQAAQGLALATDTGAFVPSDFRITGTDDEKRNSLLIGSRDVRPRLEAIDKAGVSGMVVVDSCFSENSVRSFLAERDYTYRFFDAGLDYLGEFPTDPGASRSPYPYRRLVTIAASSEREKALDWGRNSTHLTHDGQPHGAFTDSLLRTIRDLGDADSDHDDAVTNRELFRAVRSRMAQADLPHSPQFQPAPGEDAGVGDSPAFRQAVLSTTPPPRGRPLQVHVNGALPLVRAAVAEDASLEAAAEQDHDLRVERVNGAVHLVTRYGDQVMLATSEQAAANALRQQPWIRRLVASHNADQRFEVDLLMDQGETYTEGDVLDLAVSSDRDAHLLVVAVAADGTFRVLHPGRLFSPVRADTPVTFQTKVNEPFGIDHVVAAGFLERPPFYDDRLVASDAIHPGSRLHAQLRAALVANDPNQARAVSRVVTVPARPGGG